jgi:hypothetical protein
MSAITKMPRRDRDRPGPAQEVSAPMQEESYSSLRQLEDRVAHALTYTEAAQRALIAALATVQTLRLTAETETKEA